MTKIGPVGACRSFQVHQRRPSGFCERWPLMRRVDALLVLNRHLRRGYSISVAWLLPDPCGYLRTTTRRRPAEILQARRLRAPIFPKRHGAFRVSR